MVDYAVFNYPETGQQVKVGSTHTDVGTYLSLWITAGGIAGVIIAIVFLIAMCHS